jgi:hypothetical protein
MLLFPLWIGGKPTPQGEEEGYDSFSKGKYFPPLDITGGREKKIVR